MIARPKTAIAGATSRVWSIGQALLRAFDGHNPCAGGGNEWIHEGNLDIGGMYGLIDAKSFHPKPAGQFRYAVTFSDALIARTN